jgi:hypothetical protein
MMIRCFFPVTLSWLLAGLTVSGAEMGALAYRFGVVEGNYTSPYAKSGTDIVQSAVGAGWKCFGSAGAGAVAVQAVNQFPNSGSPRGYYVRGNGYWFEQFVITAPGIPDGTMGEARFTLHFDGGVSVGPYSTNGTAQGKIFYRVESTIGPDAQPNTSGSYSGDIRYLEKNMFVETGGANFIGTPQEHVIQFRFGQLTNLTIYLQADTYRWTSENSFVNAELRFKGWNGFDWVKVAGAGETLGSFSAVSTTGLDMALPTKSTFQLWRTLYDLSGPSAEPDADPNDNGLSNFVDYALGLNPLETSLDAYQQIGQSAGLISHEGKQYLGMSYTRPRSGKPADVAYIIERSSTLTSESWTSDVGGVVPVSVVAGPDDRETVTVRSTTPVSGAAQKGFMRLKIAPVPPQ